MKKLALFVLCSLVVFAAACGGNSAKPGNGSGNTAGGEHGDDHGKMTDLGKKKLGDREVGVEVSEWVASKGEGVAEVDCGADGDKCKVNFWVEQDGKEVSPKKAGEWVADEKKFDCHVELKKDLKAGKYKLVVEVDGKKDSWDVEVK
ncbi:MAG: hypothetical protein KBG84_15250 [Planctomycetes bacterium]|nr:hypothetical protein [Planctomycetota bacterium]